MTAHTPNRASWQVGFYDHRSGERLPQVDGGTSYTFGEVTICPAGFTVSDCQPGGKADVSQDGGRSIPIPVHVQFAGNITLAGYSFNSRTPVPGAEMTVTLYWTASGPVAESYTVFAHLLTDSFEMFGGADLQPSPPTESWAAGETVATVHTFTVPPDAPPGLYQVEIGLYTRPDFQTAARARQDRPGARGPAAARPSAYRVSAEARHKLMCALIEVSSFYRSISIHVQMC